jgi:hypothetical protein
VASLDEELKRRRLADLAASQLAYNTETSFQREMLTDPFLAQAQGPAEYRRSIDAAARADAEAQQSLRDAQILAQQPVAQDPVYNNFLTRRVDNPALDLLRNIVSTRLINRGVLENPLDIAKRNLNALEARNQQIDTLTKAATARSDFADDVRAQAFALAQSRGVQVDPRLAQSPEDQVSLGITTSGLNFNPQEVVNYQRSLGDLTSDARVNQLANEAFARGEITEDQKDRVLSARGVNKLDTFENLVRIENLGAGLERRTTIAGEVTETPSRDAIALARRYEQPGGTFQLAPDSDIESRDRILNNLDEVNDAAAQARRVENSLRYAEIVPLLTKGVIEGDQFISGAVAGRLPAFVRDLVDAQSRNIESIAGAIAQQSLRETLGGQFAVQENIQLQQRFYDPTLPVIFNLARIRRSQKLNDFIAREVDRLEEHMALYGFEANGPTVDGKTMPFRRRKVSEIFEEMNAGEDGLSNLLDEFNEDELIAFANGNKKNLEAEYNGVKVRDSIKAKLAEILKKKEQGLLP